MRHFSRLAGTEALLPFGVLAGSTNRALVLRASSTTGFAPANFAASARTVDLAVVTAAAHRDLLVAACAVE
jgi:hypothetical protein